VLFEDLATAGVIWRFSDSWCYLKI